MAFTTEAYYEQTTNNGVVDKIEIQQDGGTSRNIQLQADASRNGFKWRLSEITSDSDDGLINPLANKIQEGKLTFYPRIDTTAKETLLNDIIDSPDSEFRVVWKQKQTGGTYSTKWTGNVDNKMRTYPEKGGSYFAVVRANDFDLLKTTDYALDDTRQTLITTIADLLGTLNFGLSIRTATSWITENTTDTTDFLSQIYHETKALREFSRTGQETDQPISVWDALTHVGDPALLFRQVNGEFTVEQLSEFNDPTTVHETLYNPDGTVNTATTTVDRTLNADKSIDSGDLVVTRGSQNDRYPAVKRASVQFQHRTEVSRVNEISFDLDDSTVTSDSESQTIISDGDQTLDFSFFVLADTSVDAPSSTFSYVLKAGTYYWDQANYLWTENGGMELTNDVDLTKTTDKPGLELWIGNNSYLTDNLPSDADGLLTVKAYIPTNMENATVNTRIFINNAQAAKDSKYINFQLTQSNGYTTNFDLGTTWFGDGPVPYSPSALRYGTGDGDITQDSWQRRGTTTGYRNFQENLLKEILDLQRSNVRKLNANFWGSYDPSKILVYDAENFYCAGVSYSGHLGRWSANLFRINIQTGTDTFDDIPKFADESSTGTSSTEDSTSTGGGIDQSTADARYFNESELLGEIATADIDTALTNLGLKDGSRDLDLNSLSLDSDITTPLTFDRTDNTGVAHTYGIGVSASDAIIFSNTTDGLTLGRFYNDQSVEFYGETDVDGAFSATSLRTDSGKFLSPTSYQFRNAGDTGFRDVEMAQLNSEGGAIIKGSPSNTSGGSLEIEYNSGGDYTELLSYDRTVDDYIEARYRASNHLFNDGTVEFQDTVEHTQSAGTFHSRSIVNGSNTTGNRRAHEYIGNFSNYFGGGRDTYALRHRDDDGSSIATILDYDFDTTNLAVPGNFFVGGGLYAKEFVVEQTRVMFDFRMAPGGGKVESVDLNPSTGTEKVILSDEFGAANPLSVGAIVIIQQRTGQDSGVIIKKIVRRVFEINPDGDNNMEVTLTDGGINWDTSQDVGVIEAGDDIVYEGHTTDSTLDHYIHFDIANVEIPSIRFWDGVDDVGAGSELMRVGGLDGYNGGGAQDIGIGIGGDYWNATDGTGSVGSGVLTWDRDNNEVGLANFTARDDYLTDTDVFIGNNVSRFDGQDKMMFGFWDDSSLPALRLRTQDTAGGANYVAMFARTSPYFFRILADGDIIANVSSDSAKFFGAFVDSDSLWAGGGATSNPATKSDSNFWAKFDTGEFFYDAMVITVWARNSIAGFGAGSTADSIQNNEWTAQRSSSVAGENVIENKIKARYRHRFGINNMLLNYLIRVDSSGDGTGTGAVYLTVRDQSGTSVASDNIDLGPSGITEDTLEVDISSLNPGQYYVVEVDLEAQVGNVNSGTVTITSYLREDAIIYATT